MIGRDLLGIEDLSAGDIDAEVLRHGFAEDDLVNQTARRGIDRRRPGNVDTANLPLERLQERHEIPDRENVVLHERAECAHRVDPLIERMLEQSRPERIELRVDFGDLENR